MSKIIAICNQKGGTGKTTTAINLATYVALIGKKTLLIDIDPQGNSTSGLGIAKDELEHSVYELLLGEVTAQQVVIPTQVNNLFLIPSNVDLTGAEIELVGAIGREHRLKKHLASIQDDFDFIFIDCPPSLGLLTVNSLVAAGYVLIPVQCEYYALEGLSLLVNTVNLVKENLNPNLQVEGVILTMADFRTNLTHEVINEARKYFKEKVYDTVIPRNVRLTEAPSYGKPVALYDKHSLGARQYERLAYEFLKMPMPEEVLRPKDIVAEIPQNISAAVPKNRLENIDNLEAREGEK
jgi:chromosome partitioning protein